MKNLFLTLLILLPVIVHAGEVSQLTICEYEATHDTESVAAELLQILKVRVQAAPMVETVTYRNGAYVKEHIIAPFTISPMKPEVSCSSAVCGVTVCLHLSK